MIPSPGQMSQSTNAYITISSRAMMWLGTGKKIVKQWPLVGDIAVRIGQNSVPTQAKL